MSEDRSSRTRPVLSNLTIGWIGIAVLLLPVATAAVWLIIVGVPDALARVEVITTAALTGLALSGIVMLLLAARRQRGLELERWDRYRVAQEAAAADERREHAAAQRRRDTTQRRDAELYASAVAQLGSERAAVRLGGLYALAQLGQDVAAQRQLVIDVLCAYLRMPPDMPAAATAEHAGCVEREVRLTTQRILHRHLRLPTPDGTEAAPQHWPGMDIDLTGAWLERFTLSGCTVESARFDGARFRGDALLDRARFRGAATFEGAHFTADTVFAGTRFDAEAGFGRMLVEGDAWFGGAGFAGDAVFERARFGKTAQFEKARFVGVAEFREAEFAGPAGFRRTWFGASARFDGARFADSAAFDYARFDGDVRFGQARFAGSTEFTGARAEDWAPAQPSSWPQGWTTRPAEEPGRLALVEAAATSIPVVPEQTERMNAADNAQQAHL